MRKRTWLSIVAALATTAVALLTAGGQCFEQRPVVVADTLLNLECAAAHLLGVEPTAFTAE